MAATNQEIGARVRSLLEAHGMSHGDLASHLGIDPSALSRAVSGDRMFKALEIARIAEVLNVPTSVILEGRDDESPVLVAARRSAHDQNAVSEALDRAEFFIELAALVDSRLVPDFSYVELPEAVSWRQGHAAAEQVLRKHNLDETPLPGEIDALASLVEQQLGIQVAREPIRYGLDGMSVSCNAFRLALVSSSVAPARQRWTLAHEIGHLVLGDTDDLLVDENVWSSRSSSETRANAFAAAFLMPAGLLSNEWGSAIAPSQDLIEHLLDTFHVSLDSLAFRLHNVGAVNAAGRDAIRQMRPLVSMMRNQGTRQAEGMWLPGQLTSDAINAYGQGRIGVRWLAELVRLDPDDLLNRLRANDEEAGAMEAAEEGEAASA